MDDFGFLQGLIHGLRCGVLAIDVDGRLLMLNEPARQILEIERIPPRGVSVERALAMYPELLRVLLESFAMSSLPNRAEIDLEPSPGYPRKTIGFTISLIPGADGNARGAAMFFKDLTQIEHTEEQDRLKDRLAALGQMAASMAHEIRNPLAAIEVSCSLLKRRLDLDQKGLDLLDKIVAEVSRLSRTVDSSLEFVRPVSLNLESAELAPLLEEAVTVAADRIGKPGIKVQRRFRGGIPAFLMDRTALRQVFVNLILNAMEAVGEQGTVTVSTEVLESPQEASVPYLPGGPGKSDPWRSFERLAVVRIADTGPGISEEALDRLFYPFYTTKKLGSGVGLCTAKKIVDSHRGLIDVANSPAGGAVFTVRLPMVREQVEA